MRSRSLELEVMRYDPEQDEAPYFQTYHVECQEDWAILDVLNTIKEDIDPTLNFRWSCHMMVCGSCGMTVNGEPSLTCKVFVRDLPDRVRVEALENFPIERDLVVVQDDVMDKLQKAQLHIIRDTNEPGELEEYEQSPAALEKFKQFTMCINCMCCYSACPQYALDRDFIGPAVLALAHRYNLDSRDQGRKQRLNLLADHDGAWNCSFVGACSEVCPKHVDPAAAIQQMKIEASIEWVKDRLLPGGKKPVDPKTGLEVLRGKGGEVAVLLVQQPAIAVGVIEVQVQGEPIVGLGGDAERGSIGRATEILDLCTKPAAETENPAGIGAEGDVCHPARIDPISAVAVTLEVLPALREVVEFGANFKKIPEGKGVAQKGSGTDRQPVAVLPVAVRPVYGEAA